MPPGGAPQPPMGAPQPPMQQGPLQSYGSRNLPPNMQSPGQPPMPHHASDADFLDENAYAPSNSGMPDETDPMGLMDRLYREQLTGRPMVKPPMQRQQMPMNNSVPTTKNRF